MIHTASDKPDHSCFPRKPSWNISLLRLLFLKEKVLGGQGFAQLTHEHRNTLPGKQKHLYVESLCVGRHLRACPQQASAKYYCESSLQPGSKRNLTTCAESKLLPRQSVLACYFPGWYLLAPAWGCSTAFNKSETYHLLQLLLAAQPISQPAHKEGQEAWNRPLPCSPKEKP